MKETVSDTWWRIRITLLKPPSLPVAGLWPVLPPTGRLRKYTHSTGAPCRPWSPVGRSGPPPVSGRHTGVSLSTSVLGVNLKVIELTLLDFGQPERTLFVLYRGWTGLLCLQRRLLEGTLRLRTQSFPYDITLPYILWAIDLLSSLKSFPQQQMDEVVQRRAISNYIFIIYVLVIFSKPWSCETAAHWQSTLCLKLLFWAFEPGLFEWFTSQIKNNTYLLVSLPNTEVKYANVICK